MDSVALWLISQHFIDKDVHLLVSFKQPMSMVLPGVVGFKLTGKLRNGVTATDLVLTVTQMLRKHGVVGKFVEFYGNYISSDICLFLSVFQPLVFCGFSFLR